MQESKGVDQVNTSRSIGRRGSAGERSAQGAPHRFPNRRDCNHGAGLRVIPRVGRELDAALPDPHNHPLGTPGTRGVVFGDCQGCQPASQ